jgi:hypothetical protein
VSVARQVAWAVASLLLVTSCTSDPAGEAADTVTSDSSAASSKAPSTAAPAADPPPRAPRNGACYRLPFAEATRPSSSRPPVSCRARHDAQTIHVGRLDTVVDGHAVAVDSDHVVDQLSTACPRRMAAHVGGSPEDRRLSRLQVVWFAPTLAQAERGARWYRCDLVAVAGRDRLFPLPGPRALRGVLDRPAGSTYALCGTTDPGAPDFARVICARPHSWRAVATIDIPGGRRYPGAAVREAGDDDCRDLVRSRAEDPLKFRYGWEWPTREQWRGGQHHGFCWAPD